MGPTKVVRLPFPLALQGEGGATAPGEVCGRAFLRPFEYTLLSGAGNGTRTRDPELGRLALYQLSYSRFAYVLNSPLRTLLILHDVWWRGEDSNLRRRSPSDLQSDPFGHSGTSPPYFDSNHSRWSESNRRPTDYKSVALPTELHRQRAKEGKLFAGYHAVKDQPIEGTGVIRGRPSGATDHLKLRHAAALAITLILAL